MILLLIQISKQPLQKKSDIYNNEIRKPHQGVRYKNQDIIRNIKNYYPEAQDFSRLFFCKFFSFTNRRHCSTPSASFFANKNNSLGIKMEHKKKGIQKTNIPKHSDSSATLLIIFLAVSIIAIETRLQTKPPIEKQMQTRTKLRHRLLIFPSSIPFLLGGILEFGYV